MPWPRSPINLTLWADDGAKRGESASVQRLLVSANLVCELLRNGHSALEVDGEAANDEIFVVMEGHGVMRCEDGEVMEITAGDVLYIKTGIGRVFENLSPKFRALRFSLAPRVAAAPAAS